MTVRTSHRRASGAIRRLPSGRWQARYTGPDGAMRTIGTFAAKSEADQALAHEVSTMARGAWHDPRLGEQPLGEWFRGWIATRTDIAESTRALYEQVLATWIDAPVPVPATSGRPRAVHLGIRTLASLTPAVVREWNHAVTAESTRRVTERWERSGKHDTRVNAAIRAWAAASGAPLAPTGRIPGWARDGWVAATGGASVPERPLRRNAGQTAATQAYRLLHAGMSQAVADELIAANPCAIKGAGQRDAHDRVDRRTVSFEEMWALADGMPERYRASVIIAVCSGLRAGELFALQRKHVDLAAGVVRVEQSLALGRTGQGWFSAPKTRAGKRTVVLPKIAVAALREHMTRFTPPGGDSLLFGTQNGTPLSSGQRTTMFARARNAIGRDDLTWHDQRHSALTLVASTGATLPELMERAGHASPRAAIHYQHAVDDSQRRIADRLDEVLVERPRTA
jgi:integrase